MNASIDKALQQRWLDAAKLIGSDAQEKVLCPKCQDAYLNVFDAYAENDSNLLERRMTCPSCGAHNAMRMRRPVEC